MSFWQILEIEIIVRFALRISAKKLHCCQSEKVKHYFYWLYHYVAVFLPSALRKIEVGADRPFRFGFSPSDILEQVRPSRDGHVILFRAVFLGKPSHST